MTLRSSAPQAIEFSIFRTIKYIMILSPQFLRVEEQRNLVNDRRKR